MTYDPVDDLRQRYPDVHLGVRAISPARGFWCPEQRVIVVNSDLTKIERRCTLAHEIAHMDLGDFPTEMCWYETKQEGGACVLAARRLIRLKDLLEVIRFCDDAREVAAELEVTVQVLKLRAAALDEDELAAVHDIISDRAAVA